MAISRDLAKALREPLRVPGALLRRILSYHPSYGHDWIRLPDGSITFRESGFVAAGSPAALLARHHYEISCIRHYLEGTEANRSLEVGCGYGRLTPTFSSIAKSHTAIDINDYSLAQAATFYPLYKFVRASSLALPFPHGAFDLVASWTVLQHIPPQGIAAACSELCRVLAPGGMLLICEETKYPDRKTPKAHTWHRTIDHYRSLFPVLQLEFSSTIEEIDRTTGHGPGPERRTYSLRSIGLPNPSSRTPLYQPSTRASPGGFVA